MDDYTTLSPRYEVEMMHKIIGIFFDTSNVRRGSALLRHHEVGLAGVKTVEQMELKHWLEKAGLTISTLIYHWRKAEAKVKRRLNMCLRAVDVGSQAHFPQYPQ